MTDGGLTFARPRGGRFHLGPAALATMLELTQDAPTAAEAGGVLLGRHLLDGDDVVVDRVTTPQPGDRRSRFGFYRARRRHQALINQAWEESGGTCVYLGEWHTHPEPVPTPSPVDRVGWRHKLLFDVFTEPIFFVIVGTEAVCAWVGFRPVRITALGQL